MSSSTFRSATSTTSLRPLYPKHWQRHDVKLTPRQADVLRLLAMGYGRKRVADELGISVGTVKTHVSLAYTALGTRNRIQAVMRAQALLDV